MKEKELNPIEQILDENNIDNVVLYNEKDEPFEFEQIAIIPLDNEKGGQDIYAILLPVTPLAGIAEDEAVVFEVNQEKDLIRACEDEKIVDKVLSEYERIISESEDAE